MILQYVNLVLLNPSISGFTLILLHILHFRVSIQMQGSMCMNPEISLYDLFVYTVILTKCKAVKKWPTQIYCRDVKNWLTLLSCKDARF